MAIATKRSQKLLYYFHERAHGGVLDTSKSSVRRAQSGNAANREILVLFIDYQEKVIAARFQAAGSVSLIAGGEFICQWLEQKTRQEMMGLTAQFLLESLGLSPLENHIAQLIVTTVKKLIES